jgi:(1->4)-alpha-D-glucan 1-alpha-D-glucosylmutase
MMPGVPDVYQGCELVDLSLVDPDNRRPVAFSRIGERLARLDRWEKPLDLDDEKLLVTASALRLRRDRPQWFVGDRSGYTPLATSTGNAVAFGRGDDSGTHAVVIATRLPVALERHGGWGGHALSLPEGRWRDELTAAVHPGGSVPLADLLAGLPVALLTRV